MNWLFWQSRSNSGTNTFRLKEIPEPVGRYLVVKLGKDPDWVWTLKGVVQPREGRRGCFDVRVLDAAQALQKKAIISGYSSLDEHPDLILFEGWFDRIRKTVMELREISIPPLQQESQLSQS